MRDSDPKPDGKIVAAGSTFNGTNEDFAMIRYAANGSLDATFGPRHSYNADRIRR